MPMSEALQQCIDEKTDLQKLRQEAFKEGMRSLRLSGAQKVAAGITTVSEVLRVTPDKM
jgi:general secretion pathway protein E